MIKNFKKRALCAALGSAMLFSSLSVPAFGEDTLYVDKKADVAFVIDVTGSMSGCIFNVKNNISDFVSLLDGDGVDVRVKFVTFGDITCGEPTETSSWFTDVTAAKQFLNDIDVDGGGDYEETVIDGMGVLLSSSFGYRSDAAKFCVVLTDAGIKFDNNRGITTEEEIVERFSRDKINTSVITSLSEFDSYEKFVTEGRATDGSDNGILANIGSNYSILLKNFADSIISSLDIVKIERMEPNYGETGVAQTVRVTATGMVYNDIFSVTVGGKTAEVTAKGEKYFDFVTPTDLPAGKYDVIVTNGSGRSTNAGKYEYRDPADPQAPVLIKASPNKFMEFTDRTITISGKNFGAAPTVTLDRDGEKTPLSVTSATDTVIKCRTGKDISGGIYGMTITNADGLSLSVEDYFTVDYTPVPDPPEVAKISPSSFFEHTNKTLKISGSGFDSPEVYIGEHKLDVTSSSSVSVSAKTGTGISAGTYDLTLKNADGVTVKYYGSVTVKPLPVCAEIISAEPGDRRISFTWSEVDGAESYKLMAYKDGEFVREYSAGNATSCTLIKLTNDVEYRVAVLTYSGGVWSSLPPFENMYPATPHKDVPVVIIESPVISELTPGNREVKLVWNTADGAESYKALAYNASGYVNEYSAGTGTSCTFKNLTNGTEYGFCVLAYKSGKWSDIPAYADMKKAVPTAPVKVVPPAAEITELTPGNCEVKLVWNTVDGAESYKALAYNASGYVGEYSAGTGTSCTFKKLTNGTEYGFCVLAYKDGKWSDVPAYTGMQKAVPTAPVKVAPPAAEITELTPGSREVKLVWNTVDGAESYKALAYDASGYVGEYSAGTGTSCTFKKLTNGTEYGFCVLTYKGGKWSDVPAYAGMQKAVPTAPVKVAPPTAEITELTPGSREVKLVWNAVDGAESYKALAYNASGYVNEYSAGAGTSCTFKNLTNGTEYGFCVLAYKSGLWSDIPAYAEMRKAAPSAPVITVPCAEITKLEPGSRRIKLTWAAVDGATAYRALAYLDGKLAREYSAGSATSCTIIRLSKGKTYSFCVQAYKNGKWSDIPSIGSMQTAIPN